MHWTSSNQWLDVDILETQMNEHFDKPIRIRIDSTTSGSQVAFRIKMFQQDEQYSVDQVVGLLRPIFGYFLTTPALLDEQMRELWMCILERT